MYQEAIGWERGTLFHSWDQDGPVKVELLDTEARVIHSFTLDSCPTRRRDPIDGANRFFCTGRHTIRHGQATQDQDERVTSFQCLFGDQSSADDFMRDTQRIVGRN
jgi:hypothetical protein